MEFDQVIMGRRSIRGYKPDPVPVEVMREIIAKLEQLESVGVDHVALSAHSPEGARELIADFGREVIAKRGG